MIGQHLMRKWEKPLRLQVVLAVALGPSRLAKPEVDLVSAATADMAQSSIEDAAAVLILVETQCLEVVQGSRGLGYGVAEGAFPIASQWVILIAPAIAQEGDEIAYCRQADT